MYLIFIFFFTNIILILLQYNNYINYNILLQYIYINCILIINKKLKKFINNI